MSHFSVVAILPKDIFKTDTPDLHDAVQEHLAKVMEKYDENREVPEYNKECWCVSATVDHWVSERMHEQFGGDWVDEAGNVVPFSDIDEPKTEDSPFPNRRKDVKFIGGIASFRESFEPIREAINAKYPGIPGEWDFDAKWPAKGTDEYKGFLELYHSKKEELEQAWKDHLTPWTNAEANYEIEAERLGIRKPDPKCGFYDQEMCDSLGRDNGDGTYTFDVGREYERTVRVGDRYDDGSGCGGTGVNPTTYNPDSKWDWYSIGGRWDGNLTELDEIKPRKETCWLCHGTGKRTDMIVENGCNGCGGTGIMDNTSDAFHSSPQYHELKRNITLMSDATEVPPYAFLTPSGEWYGKGEMGWWGMTSGDEEHRTWAQKWGETRGAFADHYAVQLDCHI